MARYPWTMWRPRTDGQRIHVTDDIRHTTCDIRRRDVLRRMIKGFARRTPRAQLLGRLDGFQIGEDSFGVRTREAELGHGRSRWSAGPGDSGHHQRNELLVGSWWNAGQARCDDRPLIGRPGRFERNRSPEQPSLLIRRAILMARRMAPPADPDARNDVLSPGDRGRVLC